MARTKGRSEITIERSSFSTWDYERKMIWGLVLTLVYFLISFSLLGSKDQENAPLTLSVTLFVLWLAPLIYYALGSTSDLGIPLYRWRPGRWRTLFLRRLFLFQICLIFSLSAIEASMFGLQVHMWLFIIYLPVIVHYLWFIESRLTITDRGVATKVGLLGWDAIGDIRVYPEDRMIAFQVTDLRRFLFPFALYPVEDPKVVTRALMAVQRAGLDTTG